jgi:hypothetical protein
MLIAARTLLVHRAMECTLLIQRALKTARGSRNQAESEKKAGDRAPASCIGLLVTRQRKNMKSRPHCSNRDRRYWLMVEKCG